MLTKTCDRLATLLADMSAVAEGECKTGLSAEHSVPKEGKNHWTREASHDGRQHGYNPNPQLVR